MCCRSDFVCQWPGETHQCCANSNRSTTKANRMRTARRRRPSVKADIRARNAAKHRGTKPRRPTNPSPHCRRSSSAGPRPQSRNNRHNNRLLPLLRPRHGRLHLHPRPQHLRPQHRHPQLRRLQIQTPASASIPSSPTCAGQFRMVRANKCSAGCVLPPRALP